MKKKTGSLDIEEDPRFQRQEWVFQQVGRVVLFAFVLAALLGVTGMGGLLSHGNAGDRGDPVHVEYERFVRSGGESVLKLHLRTTPGEVRFWVGAPYVERVRIASVAPAPERTSVESDRLVYMILAGSRDVTVTLEVEHPSSGILDAEVGLVDGPSVRFSQVAIF